MTSLTLYEVPLRFRTPLATPEGEIDERRSVVVALSDGDSAGWAEAPLFPTRSWGSVEDVWSDLTRRGEPTMPVARAALEAAHADLTARTRDLPLHTLLGSAGEAVPATATLGLAAEPDHLVAGVAALVASGVRSVKIKIAPGRDLDGLRAVRNGFPRLDVSVDCNGTYASHEDPVFAALDDLDVSLVEQPLPPDDLAGAAALRRRLAAAVCLDEAVRSVADAVRAMEAEAADLISVKMGRLGIATASEIAAEAVRRGIAIKLGGTFDTAIGRRSLLAMASHPGVAAAEIAPPGLYLLDTLGPYPALEEGKVAPTGEPGIGFEPDRGALEERALRVETVELQSPQ